MERTNKKGPPFGGLGEGKSQEKQVYRGETPRDHFFFLSFLGFLTSFF